MRSTLITFGCFAVELACLGVIFGAFMADRIVDGFILLAGVGVYLYNQQKCDRRKLRIKTVARERRFFYAGS